jgi:hypothetical protein
LDFFVSLLPELSEDEGFGFVSSGGVDVSVGVLFCLFEFVFASFLLVWWGAGIEI